MNDLLDKAAMRPRKQVDSCNAPSDHTDAYIEYATVRDALNQTGRQIFFSLCGWVALTLAASPHRLLFQGPHPLYIPLLIDVI